LRDRFARVALLSSFSLSFSQVSTLVVPAPQ
jgi:hypothetical protein